MSYKDTLNLPLTDFPMKADLPKREPSFLEKWEREGTYFKLLEKNKGKPLFVLHDGPPYANGHIHFGHILNKVLKDIIIKYKNMSGYRSPYVPGWDCHGLPIELGAIKELGAKEKDPTQFRNNLVRREACRGYANHFIDEQRKEFVRLGIMGDWQNPYLTLTNQYEADIAREFLDLYLKGYVFPGKKPVYWCPSCRTALAEAEVEYEKHTSPSIYVPFEIVNSEKLKLPLKAEEKAHFVIWTTTPWTLPANLALAIGENFEYEALRWGGRVLLIASQLKGAFLQALQGGECESLGVFQGSDLLALKLTTHHPFLMRSSPVFAGPHVTLEQGTGVVHIAPGHGQEDYQIGVSQGLDVLCVMDGGGKLIPEYLESARFPEVKTWGGLSVKEANKAVVSFLHEKSLLLNPPDQTLEHSYPHCWRCKNPVIYRATEQWFCSLEHNDLRKRALRAINGEVKWIPSWGHDRIFGMIENRPDWCLSRQRIWGVPIIIHKCARCQHALLNEKIGQHIIALFEKEGADAWWKYETLLPEGTTCPQCQCRDFVKEGSILDVWFDSGVSHAAVLERNPQLASPADLYLEGSDQHRGWFHSSLLTSLATRNRAPYKAVLTHGFVVDGQGKKYSKSAKNYIPPDKILNQMGAELLRLWVGAEDYRNDIRVSDEIIKVLAEIYRKIRNTCRFMLGNLSDFDSAAHYVSLEKRTELDRYALSLLAKQVERVKAAYENYEFHVVHYSLNEFFTVALSAIYLDVLKDRLYCDKSNGALRRSAQSTIYDILVTVVPLMAPILSFTAEEVWQFIPHREKLPSSVFLAEIPSPHPHWLQPELEGKWQRIGMIREDVLKSLEVSRQKKEIGHPLDAKVVLVASGESLSFLSQYASEWTQIFIVSQVEIKAAAETDQGIKIFVSKADGEKCERCWNYSTFVGQDSAHPTLCQRCVGVVS